VNTSDSDGICHGLYELCALFESPSSCANLHAEASSPTPLDEAGPVPEPSHDGQLFFSVSVVGRASAAPAHKLPRKSEERMAILGLMLSSAMQVLLV
jgi:hypothetical protein